MSRFFIDSVDPVREGSTWFQVLVESDYSAVVCNYGTFAKLLGVASVDPEDVVAGAMFSAGNEKPVDKLTTERKKLLDAMLKAVSDQLPPMA